MWIIPRFTAGGSRYAPELEKRCRPQLKATNDSWRVDETYVKVRKTWMYLYRAVDSEGNTLEFRLSPTRDAEAAKCFFLKALHSTAGSASRAGLVEEPVAQPPGPTDLKASRSAPRVINVDKHAAYPKAIAELKAAGILPESVELRQVKYLNDLVDAATIVSSNGWSNRGWASFPLRQHGEHYKDLRA